MQRNEGAEKGMVAMVATFKSPGGSQVFCGDTNISSLVPESRARTSK